MSLGFGTDCGHILAQIACMIDIFIQVLFFTSYFVIGIAYLRMRLGILEGP